MIRAFAVESKIARSVDYSSAEMPFPDSIYNYSHCQRLAQNSVREFEPPASLAETDSFVRRQHRQEASRNHLTQIIRIAAQADGQVNRLLLVSYPVNVR